MYEQILPDKYNQGGFENGIVKNAQYQGTNKVLRDCKRRLIEEYKVQEKG